MHHSELNGFQEGTMKKFKFITLVLSAAMLCSCSGKQSDGQEPAQEEGEHETVAVFPKTDLALVGDTMPFYDGGKMNVFYLADQRDGKLGYHPWALLTTEDYCTYEDKGIVLSYGETAEDQDIALGTGCVMKDQNGLYHAFFTGHNDYREPKEAIMHATSSDMLNWTKIPGDTFISNENYSTTDFRDPYVFYVPEEQQYWMLIVTRTKAGGVIVKYVSKDLSKWEDKGIFFEDDLGYGTNMECPTLIQFNGKWYLTFSDQWPDRVVHIRVSDSINGPFTKPARETLDGNGFYAGRLETDGTNLYAVGWNGTKIGHDDENDYDWAGNMVVHQLAQNSDGSLRIVVNDKVKEKLSHKISQEPVKMTKTVTQSKDKFQMKGEQYELVQFEAFDETGRIEADITGYQSDDMFGIAFAPDMDSVGTLNYVFNVPENKIEFYNNAKLMDGYPQSSIDFDFSKTDKLHVTLLTYDGVTCLYVNDEIALTARMYRSNGTNWQLFGINSGVTWENVSAYE